MSLRRIHIADHKGRESSVSFTSLRHQQNVGYFYEESPVKHTRLLSDSKTTNIEQLSKTFKDNLAEEIINNHVDLNMEIFGKQVSDTDVVLLDSQSQILYSPPKIQEEIYNNKRELQKTQDPIEMEANVRDDTPPLRWTKNLLSREEAISKFIFKKSLQLFHNDGLTFEFLFNMAKELHEKKQMVLLGAGEKGTDPIILQSNGTPYRGFLDGYVDGNKYKLFIRLSNQELKLP
tara:strand:- start:1563 stop:2261 length:699 start_codon:yes stop_codon:yes gene_type:complete